MAAGGGMGGYSGLIGEGLGAAAGLIGGAWLGSPGVAKPDNWNPTQLNLGTSTADFQKLFHQYFSGAGADASQTNRFNIDQALQAYTQMQPDFSGIQSQLGSNTLSMEKGQLPSDVVSSIGRAAASQGIQDGFAGGGGPQGSSFLGTNGAASSLDLRNLGMTSLDISNMGDQLGLQVDSQAKALSPVLASPTDFMPSFSQTLGVDQYNNELVNTASLSNLQARNNYEQNLLNAQYIGKENVIQGMMEGASVGSQACWVARAVLGETTDLWTYFRSWLYENSPDWFFTLYIGHGEKFAEWLKDKPVIKSILRPIFHWVAARKRRIG